MVRVNKNKLPDKQLKALFTQLADTFERMPKGQSALLLDALLGPEEKVMIAKRLTVIIMLHEGYSLYKISETVKVSTSMVHKLKMRYDLDRYDTILSYLQSNKKNYKTLLTVIESILTVGGIMPHYGQARLR